MGSLIQVSKISSLIFVFITSQYLFTPSLCVAVSYVGFSHPLGMQSGKIHASQMSSSAPVDKAELNKARLFGRIGWKPNLPLSPTTPPFIQVSFVRKKKITSLIIQDNISSGSFKQAFSIVFGGSSSVSSPQDITCVFGSGALCSHTFASPIRANSVQIKGLSYDVTKQPTWRIELGGMDYMEADHHWRFDKIMMRPGKSISEFPDERGSLSLGTTLIPYEATVANRFIYTSEFNKLDKFTSSGNIQVTAAASGCIWNPLICKNGLSISFWFKTDRNNWSFRSNEYSFGFLLDWIGGKKMKAVISIQGYKLNCLYVVPECRSRGVSCRAYHLWRHFAIVWSAGTGLKVLVNGVIQKKLSDDQDASNVVDSGSYVLKLTSFVQDLRIWDYVLTTDEVNEIYKTDSIDFTIPAYDNIGNWKLGTGCTETANTGPCTDQSFQSSPGENIDLLLLKGGFMDFSSYYNFNCYPYSQNYISSAKPAIDRQYGVAAVTGLTFQIDQNFNYEEIKSFIVYFISSSSNTKKVNARIYIASAVNYDGQYNANCRNKNSRYDILDGPVYWNTDVWVNNKVYGTPDLVNIVRPFLVHSSEIWRQYVFVIIEWLADPGTFFSISFKERPHFILKYADKRPGNYLYADASLAPHTGYPLKYTTRPFIPMMKCLSFWYHMYGDGIGTLSVSIQQNASLHEEIFRLTGSQGKNWTNASVPLENLNPSSNLFQVTFTAIRGQNTAGDIAIDSIKVSITNCSLSPLKGRPPRNDYGSLATTAAQLKLPLPYILLPLDSGLYYLANQKISLSRSVSSSQHTSDTFGFPLKASYFNHTMQTAINVLPTDTIQINSGFTITFHVQSTSLRQCTIVWMGNTLITKDLYIDILSNGNISISLSTLSEPLQIVSKFALTQNVWLYLAFTYSYQDQTLKIYSNGEVKEEFKVGVLKQFSQPLKIVIGSLADNTNGFTGHLACVQFFNEYLESHVIKALKLCMNKYVPHACSSRCEQDGVCDQITGKCLCPPYANRYVLDDCSSALRKSLYNEISIHVTFDSRIKLIKHFGNGDYHNNMITARSHTAAAISKQLYFTTSGAINLAICTASDLPIRSASLNQGCAVKNACPSGYSVSMWVMLPSKIDMINLTSIDIMSLSYMQIQFHSASNQFLAINVTSGSQMCHWRVVNSSQEIYGVWTNLVVSVNQLMTEVTVFINGIPSPASKLYCSTTNSQVVDFYLGGGSPYICFDEFVLWDRALTYTDAKNLFNAVYLNGYEETLKTISFSILSFDDERNSLWSLDTNNTVYYYSLSFYWIKVDTGFIHISSGRNGVWAVDINKKIQVRVGISSQNPYGTSWSVIDPPLYGSYEISRVHSGSTTGIAFAISTSFMVLCLMVSNGNIKSMTLTNFYLKDISCSGYRCWGNKMDGTTYHFISPFTCPTYFTKLSFLSSQLDIDSRGIAFRVHDGDIYRFSSLSYVQTKIEEKIKFKYVIGVNGQPVGITTSGELKMIGTGENVFQIFHSGGLCLQKKSDNNVYLGEKCALFELSKNGCWKDLHQQWYIKPGSLGTPISYTPTCDPNSLFRDPMYTIKTKNDFLLPESRVPFPARNTKVISASYQAVNFKNMKFYFKEASAFKRINSFYPKRKTQGTPNSELKIDITIMFRLRDLQFFDNFRDIHGIHAKIVYTQVMHELDQIFTESSSYVKSTFGEITKKRTIITWCITAGQCNRPLELEFTGSILFSSIKNYEKTLLLSDKFNGEITDCKDHICSFTLSNKARASLISKPKIQFLKSTASSLIFQYIPPEYHGIHTGYTISYVAERKLQPGILYMRSFVLKDGLIFTIPSLFPYAVYNLTIQPIDSQSKYQPPFVMQSETSENAPTQSPAISLAKRSKFSSRINISQLASYLDWNGNPQGYKVFYAKTRDLPEHLRVNFDAASTHLFHWKNVPYPNNFVVLKKLELFTKYVSYIGAQTTAGVGPVSRLTFRTKPGPPEQSPQDLEVVQLNSSHVNVTWKALERNKEIWNSIKPHWLGYELFVTERSIPSVTTGNSTVFCNGSQTTSQIIGPLAENREYTFEIKAMNRLGVSENASKVCFLTKEGVPVSAPRVFSAASNSSSSLKVTVGDIDLKDEKGSIVYYNISVELAGALAKQHYQVILSDFSVQAGDSTNRDSCNNVTRNQNSYICPEKPTMINASSFVITSIISNLAYWTRYDLEVSGCTCQGCGVFSSSIRARTDEHTPACSSTEIINDRRTSVSLVFSWNEPLLSCTHGVITGYRVYFGPKQDFENKIQRLSEWFPLTEGIRREYYHQEAESRFSMFGQLKKYFEYCLVVAAATSKGFGPVSSPFCTSTLQDRPDGPPTNVSGVAIADGIEISMQPPRKDLANGIIIEYIIFFTQNNTDSIERNVTVARNFTNNEIKTIQFIGRLNPYKWYNFKALASTVIGPGLIRSEPVFVLTNEAAPSAAPRNISAFNLTKNSAEVSWMQLPEDYMNGIFLKFKLVVNETLADGSQGVVRTIYVQPVKKSLNSTQHNPIIPYENPPRNASSIFDVSSHYSRDIECYEDLFSGIFHLSLIGLRPYTTYTANIAGCTKAGCGIGNEMTFMTLESVPSSSPVIKLTSESTRIEVSWKNIPILERNGKLTNITIGWIKLCHFNISIDPHSCNRVIPRNSSVFSKKSISEELLHAIIPNLTPFTTYIVRIAAETLQGPGPRAEAIIQTKESAPVKAPEITLAYNTSGRSIKLKWKDIPLPYQYGVILGYTISFQKAEQSGNATFPKQYVNCSVGFNGYTEYELTGLDLFTEYNISIAGITSKGVGVADNEIRIRTGPYVHGGWSEWSKWNYCTENCNGGTQGRTRTCTKPPPWNGGDNCKGARSDSQICNTQRCSGMFAGEIGDDCETTCNRIGFVCMPSIDLKDSYSKYKDLGLSCKDVSTAPDWKQPYHPSYANNTGLCAGFKNIKAPVACNATPPNDGHTQRICNCFDRADVGFTEWAPWAICSKTCGGGVLRSKRECLIPGACMGNTTQFKDCNTDPCPVDGAWSEWSSYTACNKSCGFGYRHRYRKCDSPPMSSGGLDCYGPTIDVDGGCNIQICPVNGEWSSWEGNGICNQPCGGGKSILRRYCDNPKPLHGGQYCIGQDTKTKPCNEHKCKGVEVLFWFRLLDFIWDFVYYSMSHPAAQKVAESCTQNFKAVYSNASFLTAVHVKEMRKSLPDEVSRRRKRRANEQEYVVANVEVYYSAVKQTEVLYVQDYITATGKLKNLSIASTTVKPVQILSGPPRNITAKGLDPHTIQITWKAPVNISSVSNVSNYYIFYRKESSVIGQWNVTGVPLDQRVFNITRLDPVTTYRIRMTVSVEYGNGPASQEITEKTPEGVPHVPPGNLSLQSTQSTDMYVQWEPIPYKEFHGMPLGYIVQYKLYHDSTFRSKSVVYGLSAITLTSLKAFSFYIVQVYGYTATGNGPPSAVVGKTLEGVPSIPPPDVTVTHMISMDTVIVRWKAISDDKTNGRFQGYKIKYTVTKDAGMNAPNSLTSTYIIVDKYTFMYKITGLKSYATYSISILGYTKAGEGPSSYPVNADTCKCPDNIFFNWYESSPYLTKDNDGAIHGIFKELIDEMVIKSCGTCNNKKPFINWKRSLTGDNPQKRSELQVKNVIGTDYHVSCPIYGRSEMTSYAKNHVFILLVNSVGSAMIVRNEVDYLAKTLNTMKSIASVWPMLVIIMLFSWIFGILLWSSEQFNNEEFARGKFLSGSCTGFWWAYVSMTTVGYGDVTPRTVLGRSFAICWTLIGLVLMGIITGSLTSSITSKTVATEFKLYGSTVAVINKTFEYQLAVRRNGKIYSGTKTDNANDVLSALKEKRVNIALLDAFVTASQQSKLDDMQLKVKKVIKGDSGYGVVFSNELTRLETDFRSFVTSRQQRISKFIANMTNQIKVSTEKPPEVMLFDTSTPVFWMILKAELSLLGAMIALGTLYTLYRYLRGRGNKVICDSPANQIVSFVDSFEGYLEKFDAKVNKRAENLRIHHESEIKELIRLKKSLLRLEKRMKRQGELLDVSRRTSYSNEAVPHLVGMKSQKYRPIEGNWNNHTDC